MKAYMAPSLPVDNREKEDFRLRMTIRYWFSSCRKATAAWKRIEWAWKGPLTVVAVLNTAPLRCRLHRITAALGTVVVEAAEAAVDNIPRALAQVGLLGLAAAATTVVAPGVAVARVVLLPSPLLTRFVLFLFVFLPFFIRDFAVLKVGRGVWPCQVQVKGGLGVVLVAVDHLGLCLKLYFLDVPDIFFLFPSRWLWQSSVLGSKVGNRNVREMRFVECKELFL